MPTIYRFKGYRFFFYSNENTELPHIHVEYGGKYAKFWLEPVMLENSVGFNASELTQLRKFITEKEQMFKEIWIGYFNR